jgi:hypothetical protein
MSETSAIASPPFAPPHSETANETKNTAAVVFHVHDAETANWLVRKIVSARAYCHRVEQWAAAELRRAHREETFLLQRFGGQLEQWLREELASRHRRGRSINLPAGRVGLRTTASRPAIADKTQLLAWCRVNLCTAVRLTAKLEGAAAERLREWLAQNDTEARVQEQVLRSVVDAHFSATGELPDGMAMQPVAARLFIK